MERYRTFRTIIWVIAAILLIQLGLLFMILSPLSIFSGLSLLVVLLICAYLIRMSLMLIGELEHKEKNK